MADNKEFYRLDLVIGTDGVEEAERAVKAMDKLLQQTQRRAAALGKTKINPSASLKDKATASADKVTRTMNRVDRIVAKPEARLVDHVTSAAGKIGTTLTGLTRKTWRITVGVKNLALGALSGIKNSLFSLPSMLAAGGAAYGGVVAPLNLSGQMEQAGVAFETMLKSASKAQTFMDELKEFAERTPFDFAGVRDNAQRMLAFKWKQEDIIPDLTTIGDWAGSMGKGKEGIDRVVLAFGQMRAKGRIQGDEMLQLTEAGINAYDYLAKAIGVSTAAVMDLQSQGLLPAEQSIKAILKGMQQDFGGGMKKQEKTLLGLWNRMKEVFSNKLLFRWGEGIRLAVQPRLQKIGDWLDNNEKTIQHWGDMLQKTAKKATDWVADKFEKVWKLGDDPAFQNADFFGKIKIAWNKVITEPLGKWLESEGANRLTEMASKIGDLLGGGAHGIVMGGLEALSPSGQKIVDENPYVEAGKRAGEAFFSSFLETLNPGEITKKLSQTVWNVNKEAVTEPSKSNTLKAIGVDLAAIAGATWFYNTFLKGPVKVGQKVKGWFSGGSKGVATTGNAAGSGAKIAAETATKVASGIEGSAEGLSRVATYGKRASWFSKIGKILGPAGEIATFDWVDKLAFDAGDWLFGHKKGQQYSKPGVFKNPFKMETYQDDRPGVLKRLYNWANGVDDKSHPTVSNYSVSPFNRFQEIIKPVPGYQSKSLKSGDDFSIRIPDEQINQIVTPLNDLKKEITINVNMPPGLVNMTVQKDEIDVDNIVYLTGLRLGAALRAAQQNLK